MSRPGFAVTVQEPGPAPGVILATGAALSSDGPVQVFQQLTTPDIDRPRLSPPARREARTHQ